MDEREASQRRQGRQAMFVIIGSFSAWMALNLVLGEALGLTARWIFLADFAVLAALLWAMIVLVRLWRARREEGN